MKKFLNDLKAELKKLKMSDSEIKEILADHKEMIEEALKQGVSEEELAAKFGQPEKVARELYSDQVEPSIDLDAFPTASEHEPVEGYKLYKVFPATDLKELQIKLVSEDLDMYPFDGEVLEVHYNKDFKEEEYEMLLENGVFKLNRLSSKKMFNFGFSNHKTPDFVVRYPKNANLENYVVHTVSGDSKLKAVKTDALRLKSTSGDFEIMGAISKAVEISVVSGDVEIDNAEFGETKLSAVSGDFECKESKVNGLLTMNTVSGDFEFEKVVATTTNFKTVSGDFEGKEFYTETIDLRSVSGDITIENFDKLRPITVGRKKTVSGDISIK